jgi:KUP system potassium uptake protein
MKAILHANTTWNADYIIGAVSCIIWTLTLQTTLKYVLIALRADNKGEGGILALYALIRKNRKKWLYGIAIIGASALIADGVITPSITVVSAIEGLRGIEPETPVVPISLTIIVVLFFVQQFGTNAIGRLFGPLMFVWFSMIAVLGTMHIGSYLPILKAFNPYYAIALLSSNPDWFLILGAVFLCTTGAEALYSDLGHCGIHNIRISWIFVKCTLILNYLGQGAWILTNADKIAPDTNPFYAIMPQGFLLFGVIMATIAAVIASQALISGSFTIFSEAMNLNFWPRQRIKYPTDVKGQLYIPFVNGALLTLCILVILFFKNSGNMEAAYGLSITITMLMTTLLLCVYLHFKQVKIVWIALFGCFFISLESLFLVANMFKFAHGGWVTILIAGIIATVMYVWYNARIIRNHHLQFGKIEPYYPILSAIKQDESIAKYATNLVYLSKADHKGDIETKIMYSIINKHPKRADHYWLLHVDNQDDPSMLEYSVTQLIPDTLIKIDLRLGFRVQPYVNLYFRQVIEDLVEEGKFNLTSCYPSLKKFDIQGDFRFIIINRIYSNENSFTTRDKFTMNLYNIFSVLETSVPKAFGLDTSNVKVEDVPLVVKRKNVRRILQADAAEENSEE